MPFRFHNCCCRQLYKDCDDFIANEFYEQRMVVFKKGDHKKYKIMMKPISNAELDEVVSI